MAESGALLIMVLRAGLEPAQPQWSRDFKSLVSTIPPSEQKNRSKLISNAKIRVFRFIKSEKDDVLTIKIHIVKKELFMNLTKNMNVIQ